MQWMLIGTLVRVFPSLCLAPGRDITSTRQPLAVAASGGPEGESVEAAGGRRLGVARGCGLVTPPCVCLYLQSVVGQSLWQ